MCSSRSIWILLAVAIIYVVIPLTVKGSFFISYKKKTFNKSVGEKLHLTCNITYYKGDCGEITAFWCKRHGNTDCQELEDEQRYITMISENNIPDKSTQRHTELEIKSLVLNDTGFYQCNAHCKGQSAAGHIITLFIKEADNTRMQGNGCPIKTEAFSVMLYCMIITVVNFW